jgi:hypothetical protein
MRKKEDEGEMATQSEGMRLDGTFLGSAGHKARMDHHHQVHYHIRWSGKAALDWECFNTHAEAEASAKQLLLQGETYTIEEYDDACPRCRDTMNLKSAHGIAS